MDDPVARFGDPFYMNTNDYSPDLVEGTPVIFLRLLPNDEVERWEVAYINPSTDKAEIGVITDMDVTAVY